MLEYTQQSTQERFADVITQGENATGQTYIVQPTGYQFKNYGAWMATDYALQAQGTIQGASFLDRYNYLLWSNTGGATQLDLVIKATNEAPLQTMSVSTFANENAVQEAILHK